MLSDNGGGATISLSGNGTVLTGPPGAPGAKGATGATGPKGNTGARGSAGGFTLATCSRVPHKTALRCTSRSVSGNVRLTTSPTTLASVTLTRKGVTYATGHVLSSAHGGMRLLLTARRKLTPATYVLTTRVTHGRRTVTHRVTLTLR